MQVTVATEPPEFATSTNHTVFVYNASTSQPVTSTGINNASGRGKMNKHGKSSKYNRYKGNKLTQNINCSFKQN